jgi:hypothetical protein
MYILIDAIITAKYQPSVSENVKIVKKSIVKMPLLKTEAAEKLANILTENQAHCFIFFIRIRIVPLSTIEALNYQL